MAALISQAEVVAEGPELPLATKLRLPPLIPRLPSFYCNVAASSITCVLFGSVMLVIVLALFNAKRYS